MRDLIKEYETVIAVDMVMGDDVIKQQKKSDSD